MPLWLGPQLDSAIFRYTEIFLPLLAVHLGASKQSNQAHLNTMHLKGQENLLKDCSQVLKGSMYKELLETEEEKESFIAPVLKFLNISHAAPIPSLDVAFCWALHRLSLKD